jgi:hypothetical protein
VHLNGYEFCKGSSHRVLREQRSELHEAHCVRAYPLVRICEFFAPNDEVREEIAGIRRDYLRLFGEPTVRQRVLESYAFLKGCLYKMTTAIGQEPPCEPPLRRYEYDRRPRGPLEKPYVVTYPHPDPRWEHEKRAYGNEMKILDRVVDLLEKGEPLDRADHEVQRIHQVFENLEAIGQAATLLDDLGDSVGLSKGWLRSEVLRGVEASRPPAPPGVVEAPTPT